MTELAKPNLTPNTNLTLIPTNTNSNLISTIINPI